MIFIKYLFEILLEILKISLAVFAAKILGCIFILGYTVKNVVRIVIYIFSNFSKEVDETLNSIDLLIHFNFKRHEMFYAVDIKRKVMFRLSEGIENEKYRKYIGSDCTYNVETGALTEGYRRKLILYELVFIFGLIILLDNFLGYEVDIIIFIVWILVHMVYMLIKTVSYHMHQSNTKINDVKYNYIVSLENKSKLKKTYTLYRVGPITEDLLMNTNDKEAVYTLKHYLEGGTNFE